MKRRYLEIAVKLVRTDKTKLKPLLVKTLAASIARDGLLTPISVTRRGTGYGVVSGRHRLAAVCRLGHRSIDCFVVPAAETQAHHRALVLTENVVRNHWSGDELNAKYKELVELWTEIHEADSKKAEKLNDSQLTQTEAKPESAGGRPKTPQGRAVDDVAEAVGKTPKAVRSAVERAKKAASKPKPSKTPKPEAWEAFAKRMIAADRALQRAQAELGGAKDEAAHLIKAAKVWAVEQCEKWERKSHTLAHEIRFNTPVDSCPTCRGGGCKACDKRGFVSKRRVLEIKAAKQ